MGWTAGADVTTGDLVTSATWNNYLGASGSIEYLKTEADRIDDLSFADQTGVNALDTTYTNGANLRLVLVTINSAVAAADGELNGDAFVVVKSDSATPPVTELGYAGFRDIDLSGLAVEAQVLEADFCISFLVLPGEKYRVEDNSSGDGTATVVKWVEWDLF
uniref:Uncharacterized protein n=1 Tax=viral metagenome TaxID=1070528 RepID=A0A6M3KP52_9ZZZZ